MGRIDHLRDAPGAIRDALAAVRNASRRQGTYDGHDIVNWLNDHRNHLLNDIIDCYPRGDSVHIATIQIGNFLRDRLHQTKVGVRISERRIALLGGSSRNGKCKVSLWRI